MCRRRWWINFSPCGCADSALVRYTGFSCSISWKKGSRKRSRPEFSRFTGSKPGSRRSSRSSLRSAKSRFRRRSNSRVRCAKRAEGDRYWSCWRRASRAKALAFSPLEIAGNGYLNLRLERGVLCRRLALRHACRALRCDGGKNYRRAHQHQPQQSRAHRPSSQRDFRRYVRPHDALGRPQCGDAELEHR